MPDKIAIANKTSHHAGIELFEDYSDELLNFASAACILLMIVGVPGNLLTIVALSRGKQTRNSTAIFIINLSLSDLLFVCFNLPLAASTFMQRSWTYSELLCRLFPLLRYGLMAVSLITVSLITINRYVIIAHPRQYPRIYQRRYLILMLISTWITCFSVMIPTWHGIWGRFGLDTEIGSCSILPDTHGRSPKEFLFVIAFFVPCVCIVYCYARIFCLVRKAAIRSREPATATSSASVAKSISFRNEQAGTQSPPPKRDSGGKSAPSTPQLLETPPLRPFAIDEDIEFIDVSDASEQHLPLGGSGEQRAKSETTTAGHERNDASGMRTMMGKTEKTTGPLADDPSENNTKAKNPNSKNPLTTSLKTSFNRFNPRKTHYVSMGNNTSNASSIYPGKMSQKDRRLLKMILVIFALFVICYLPITITKIWKSATENHIANISGYLLVYLTTCINPLIYVLMSNEYRQAYWNLLCCRQNNQIERKEKKTHNDFKRAPKA